MGVRASALRQDSRRRVCTCAGRKQRPPPPASFWSCKVETRPKGAPAEQGVLRALMESAYQQEFLSNDRMQTVGKDLGDTERHRLVLSHMRLVVSMARKYGRLFKLPPTDLIQEGCLGLIHAARKFDASKQVSFASYATPWVLHYMRRAEQNQSAMIRLPVGVFQKHSAILQTYKVLMSEQGQPPTVRQIAERLEIQDLSLIHI